MKKILPGLALSFALALVAFLLGKVFPVVGGPVFAIIFGMLLVLWLPLNEIFSPGLSFVAKKILQYAVILLGFTLNISEIIKEGKSSLPLILTTISIALITAYILKKLLKIDNNQAILIGVGSAICGGSAIAATAPVIKAGDEEIASSISVIFLFNLLAAISFPLLGQALHLSDQGFALFAGTAINDTSSVTAATTTWDYLHNSSTLATATIVKLTRTLGIIPITLGLSYLSSKKEKAKEKSKVGIFKVFPYFILFFLLASLITTIFSLPAEVTNIPKDISKFLIIMAMGAIGLNSDLKKLIKTGGKPILLGFLTWLTIIFTSLAVQYFFMTW